MNQVPSQFGIPVFFALYLYYGPQYCTGFMCTHSAA